MWIVEMWRQAGRANAQHRINVLKELTRAGPSSSEHLAEVTREGAIYSWISLRMLKRQKLIAIIPRVHTPGTWWIITNQGRKYLKERGELDADAPFAGMQ